MSQKIGVQGRNEFCTALAIEYLISLAYIDRAKPQPFITPVDSFGAAICPDFLLDGKTKHTGLIVIETKSDRFLTRMKQLELDAYREKFSSYGIRYLVWTDKRPLNHSVRHHLIAMRTSANRDVPLDDQQRLLDWLGDQVSPTLAACVSAGFDLDCIYSAAWSGKVFFPMTKPFDATTPLSSRPVDDIKAIFLDCTNTPDQWWTDLDRC